jgi:hypothetical protein
VSFARLTIAALVAGLLIASGGAVQPAPMAAAQTAPAPKRLVAIGDLHADLESAKKAFRLAGATDANDRWIGGNLVIVQMGDLIGRGSRCSISCSIFGDERRRAGAPSTC